MIMQAINGKNDGKDLSLIIGNGFRVRLGESATARVKKADLEIWVQEKFSVTDVSETRVITGLFAEIFKCHKKIWKLRELIEENNASLDKRHELVKVFEKDILDTTREYWDKDAAIQDVNKKEINYDYYKEEIAYREEMYNELDEILRMYEGLKEDLQKSQLAVSMAIMGISILESRLYTYYKKYEAKIELLLRLKGVTAMESGGITVEVESGTHGTGESGTDKSEWESTSMPEGGETVASAEDGIGVFKNLEDPDDSKEDSMESLRNKNLELKDENAWLEEENDDLKEELIKQDAKLKEAEEMISSLRKANEALLRQLSEQKQASFR